MPAPLSIAGREFVWGSRTYIVGILNLSPDSFAGDGLSDVDAAVERALQMCRDGVDLIDLGGESTRPGFQPVPLEVELARVLPVLEAIRANRVAAPISIDTTKPEVAEAALCAGAALLNDINGLRGDPRLAEVAARYGAPIIAMHNRRGRPAAADPVAALLDGFAASLACARAAGIPEQRVILDPGFGFGWPPEQNYEILDRLRELRAAGRPLLAGLSRKRLTGGQFGWSPRERFEGSAAAAAIAVANGADLLRVHDVPEMIRVAKIADAVVRRA